MKPKLIVVEGTNASGKSGLGVELALRYGGAVSYTHLTLPTNSLV